MSSRMRVWSRARALGALVGVSVVIAGCGGGGGDSGVKAGGPTSTSADTATSTSVVEPNDDDSLADMALSVDDIGGSWRREGQVSIGRNQVLTREDASEEKMFCDGREVELPDQSAGFQSMAVVTFSQGHDFPILVQELDSDKTDKLVSNVNAYVEILGACDKATVEVAGEPVGTARIQQFAMPDVGADEVYGFNISATSLGMTYNSVQILLRKGSVVSSIEYSSIGRPDENTVANIAALAVDKIVDTAAK